MKNLTKNIILFFSEFNALSPELDAITSSASIGLFVGLFLGGIPASKLEYEDFIRRNKASSFESHFDAKVTIKNAINLLHIL